MIDERPCPRQPSHGAGTGALLDRPAEPAAAPRHLGLAELAAACREETRQYLLGRAHRDEFALELLRRAICERDSGAWEALMEQYGKLVLSQIRAHPLHRTTCEGDDFWVNRTFQRFWMAVGPERLGLFPDLPSVLRYLKMCAHSVLLDEARRQRGHERVVVNLGPEPTAEVERSVLGRLLGQELWEAVAAETRDEAELVIARLSLAADYRPAEVFARHPRLFQSVAEVYRVKRNLIERVRRSPRISRLLARAAASDAGGPGES
jgi:hypothetical protein